MKTKQDIIAILKQFKTATIAFGGLSSKSSVDRARKIIITEYQKQVDAYRKLHPNDEVNLIVSDTQISAGGTQFTFLPKYPKQGKLTIRSKDFIVGDCHCQFSDILPETYNQTDKTKAFQMKSGNFILLAC